MSKPNLIGNTEEKILRQMVRKEVERQMNEYIVGQRIKSMYQDGKMVTEERKFFLFKEITYKLYAFSINNINYLLE